MHINNNHQYCFYHLKHKDVLWQAILAFIHSQDAFLISITKFVLTLTLLDIKNVLFPVLMYFS